MAENNSSKKVHKNLEEYYKSKINNINEENSLNNNNDNLLIYVLTFNMKGRTPSESDIPLLFPHDINKFDLFVISTQECLRSILSSMIISSKDEWINLLSKFFGDNFLNLINSNLGPCHLCVFVKKEKAKHFHELRSGELETGLFNFFSNKGAVSASMKYKDKNILFIGCHLAAGHNENNKRNESLLRIKTTLKTSINIEAKNKLKSYKKNINESLNKFQSTEIMYDNNNFKNNLININQEQNDTLKYTKTFVFNKNINQNLNEHKENINNIEEKEEEKNDRKLNNNLDFNELKEIESEKDENEKNIFMENHNDKDIEIKMPELFEDKQNMTINSIISNNPEIKAKEKTMDEYDFVILSGDLNYRIDFNITDDIDELIKQKNPEILWDKDQLTKEIKRENEFQEGIINFMPTYKYKDNSDEYDYERKPGWTDRILYKSKKNYDIMLCKYNCIKEVYLSDHKPVYAVFKINFKNKNMEQNCKIKNNISDDCILF